MLFSSLGLHEKLLTTLAEQGYTKPTPIQTQSIPAILSRRDVLAAADTGTGKTAGFAVPMLQLLMNSNGPQRHSVRALVLVPTRELAAQVAQSIQNYSRLLNIRITAVFGGVRIEPQIAQLQSGVDVLVATPGRLLDLYHQQQINFEQLEILVLDEADRMLDLGFIDDIHHIQTLLPSARQTMMFSATFSAEIKSLAQDMLNRPILIEVAGANKTVDLVTQTLHPVEKSQKAEVLIHLIKRNKWRQLLVFSRTKHGADKLVTILKKSGVSADSIHGNRTQHGRDLALNGFKNGKVTALVATDIASRGIDINELPCVINFDLPYVPEDYVHRIGRTGRAGNLGVAMTLYSEDESKQLAAIERAFGFKLKREIIPDFEPIKKTKKEPADEDLYGNFEADTKPKSRVKAKKRSRRGGK